MEKKELKNSKDIIGMKISILLVLRGYSSV